SASFSPVSSIFTSLAIDSKNMPYVAYVDNSVSGKASVMKYDGSSWANIDTPGFSANGTVYTSIAIDGNNNPYVGFLDAGSGGTTVMKYPVCNPSTKATVTASDSLICKGSAVTLSVSGTLNDAKNWYWYNGSFAGKPVDSGSSVTLMPGDTTTYYVRGYGGCVLSSAGSKVTVDVDSVAKPTVSVASSVLTSTAASGNQWYRNDTAITGATGATYTATTSGWYKVTVTNSNKCSATSDSVFVSGLGVANISMGTDINIYPSPFIETVHIDFVNRQYNAAGTIVYITDNMGRKVFEQKGLELKNTINLTALPSGIYFINLVTNENSEVLKVVKQ
ncbi:MAG: T9SS type A sorting domain-containing protein, partial [Bacteroidetes bacterium]|nr:T9SS type A sorting domain-containing protein [Bacteroidota bacterium]